jgi:hypothetical protein
MRTKVIFLSAISTPPKATFYAAEFEKDRTVLISIDTYGVTINKMSLEENAETLSIGGMLSISLLDYPLETYSITKDGKEVSKVVRFPNEVTIEYWLENKSFIVFDSLQDLRDYIGSKYSLEKV